MFSCMETVSLFMVVMLENNVLHLQTVTWFQFTELSNLILQNKVTGLFR